MTTMRRIVATAPGGYNMLKVANVPRPPAVLGHKQVRVQVRAAGINFADILCRQGLHPYFQPPCPMGVECAGEVHSVGEKVTQLKIGDRVAITEFSGEGAYSEELVTDESSCSLVPDSMSWETAAAMKINYLTAYFALFGLGGLQPNKSVLIKSAAGGVGWACTQLANTVGGVTVIGQASKEKHQMIEDNGIHHTLHYGQDYSQEVKKISPAGVSLIIDNRSGKDIAICQDLLEPLGKVILLGANNMVEKEFANQERIQNFMENFKGISPTDLVMKNIGVMGLNLLELEKKQPSAIAAAWKVLMNLYEEGRIFPRIDSVWSFEEIVEATKRIEEGKNIGKVVLKV